MDIRPPPFDGSPELSGALRGHLRVIYELTEHGRDTRQVRLTEVLGISPPAVSVATGRLIERGFLKGRGSLELTAKGDRVARRLVRKHRLVQCLLVDLVGTDRKSARDEADRWAFVISDRAEQALFRRLGQPCVDPSGAIIPAREELFDPEHSPSADQ